MIKRNRITALMLSAAAIVSVMPAKAYASDKIKNIKGEIYTAVAYKDGKNYIAGKPKSKDDAAYYFDGSSYKKLNNIDSDDSVSVFGTKYVCVKDGDYFVDLSSGHVSEDKVAEKEKDKAAVNLRSNVKSDNDGRYDNTDAKEVKEANKISAPKFSDGWYWTEYNVKEKSADVNGNSDKFTVYFNSDGKYVDADYNIGKLKIKLSSGKTADIKNTSEKDENTRASVSAKATIGQDSNNIYRLATITVKSLDANVQIKEINGLELDQDKTNAFSISDDGTTVSFDVIQVLSKSQASSKVNGIRYSRNVSNYILCNKNGEKVSLLSDDEKSFTVANGKLINYKLDGTTLEAEVVELKSKSSFYYVERGHNDDTKLQSDTGCIDIDSDGNLWALTDGYVRKFDNEEDFQKVYEIENDYSNMSVYDKDNMVLWNDNEYAIIGKSEPQNEEQIEDVNNNNNNNNGNQNNNGNIVQTNPSTVTKGWAKNAQGQWIYNDDTNGNLHKGWLDDSGTWYYLDTKSGIMETGWFQDTDGKWYYLDTQSGAMKKGWFQDTDGKWYYFNGSGAMLSNTWVGSYKLGSDGAWIK